MYVLIISMLRLKVIAKVVNLFNETKTVLKQKEN